MKTIESNIHTVLSERQPPAPESRHLTQEGQSLFGPVRLILYRDESAFWIMNRQGMIMERGLPGGEITRCFNYTANHIIHVPNEKTLLLARPIWTFYWIIREIAADDIYEQKAVYYDSQSAVTQLFCRNDGKKILAVFADGCVKEWGRNQKSFTEYRLPGKIISAACYHPDGKSLLLGTQDGLLYTFKEELSQNLSLPKPISKIYTHPYSKKIYAVLDNETLAEINLEDKAIRHLGEASNLCVKATIAFHPYENKALIPIGKSIVEWDLDGDYVANLYEVHKGEVTSVAYHPGGQKFLSGAKDGYVYEWDRLDKRFRRYC